MLDKRNTDKIIDGLQEDTWKITSPTQVCPECNKTHCKHYESDFDRYCKENPIPKEDVGELHMICIDAWANINESLKRSGAKFKGDGIGTAYGGWTALCEIVEIRVPKLLARAVEEERQRTKKMAEEMKRAIGHQLKCSECSPNCGYNSALNKLIKEI